MPLATNVGNLARGPPILTWNNGEIDFTFDLKTSVQTTKPFDLDLSQLIGSGGLADIANALIGLGGSGSLSLDASADLHIALALQLGQHLDIGSGPSLDASGGQHAITLTTNATGGTFTLSYNGTTTSALAHDISTADLTTALGSGSGHLGLTVNNVSLAGGTYTIDLGGSLSAGQLADIKIDGGLLTGDQQNHVTLANNATGGTFKATYNDGSDHVTTDLAYNISADGLKSALQGINLTVDGVTCTKSDGTTADGSANCDSGNYKIDLGGTLTRTALGKISVDGGSLTGSENAFFLKTGNGPDATHLTLTAQAAGTNLNFHAMIGPFGLFVKDGSASLGGTIQLNLTDGPRQRRPPQPRRVRRLRLPDRPGLDRRLHRPSTASASTRIRTAVAARPATTATSCSRPRRCRSTSAPTASRSRSTTRSSSRAPRRSATSSSSASPSASTRSASTSSSATERCRSSTARTRR